MTWNPELEAEGEKEGREDGNGLHPQKIERLPHYYNSSSSQAHKIPFRTFLACGFID